MKFLAIYLLVLVLNVSANGFSQTITLHEKSISYQRLFQLINAQTGYQVFYKANVLDSNEKISITAENLPLNEVLALALKNKPVVYSVFNKSIVIKKIDEPGAAGNSSSTIAAVVAFATIKGIVTDEEGKPLSGVSVSVNKTQRGTFTKENGSFSIEGNRGESLVFSSIGYKTVTIKIGADQFLNVKMELEQSVGDEIVVVGYGTQKKANLTGAVDQVSAKVIENRPLTDLTIGLQGVIPNLNIRSTNGAPGETGTFNIRGFTSINGGSPLLLVDGVEMDPDLLNVNDIKNITVLKDAGSAAIYGARGAFGVVLIETKSGAKGSTRVTFNENFSWGKPTILPDVIENSYEQAVAINEAMFNNDGTMYVSEDRLAKMKAYWEDPANNPAFSESANFFDWYGYTDWTNLLYKNLTPSQRHSVNVSGGNQRTQFYNSIAYSRQEGLHKQAEDFYRKVNVSIGVTDQTFKWLKLNGKMSFNSRYTNRENATNFGSASESALVFSNAFNLPFFYPGDKEEFQGLPFENPASRQKLAGRRLDRVNHLQMTIGGVATITKNLTLTSNFSYNTYRNNLSAQTKKITFLRTDYTTDFGTTADDFLFLSNNSTNYYVFNTFGTYEPKLADKIYTKFLLGYSQELSEYDQFSAQRKSLINQEQPAINLATGDQTVGGNKIGWGLRGAFTRVNFVYDDRYLFEFNARYDGSSRFPKASRYGFFPSVSAGWKVSNESFFQVHAINNLKLRASYGLLGNQSISFQNKAQYYPYIPSMSSFNASRFLFDNIASLGINPPELVSPNITWEKASTLNFGLDLGMFSDRLQFVFDWYKRTTSDMFIQVSYPQVLGAASPAENAAELQTKGWEASLSWRTKMKNNLQATFRAILSDNQAQITKYTNTTGSLTDYYVGKKLGEIWGYETQGIFQTDEEAAKHADQSKLGTDWKAGDIKYADLNGDKLVNNGLNTTGDPGDLRVIGNSTPRYSFGLSSDITFKDFFTNIFFQGVAKRDYWPGSVAAFWPFATQYYQVQKHFITETWSPKNPDAYFSRPLARQTKNTLTQSRYLQNAAYVRLKNFTIGYNLPARLGQKIRAQKVQVYLSGQNLWEFSKIKKPLDPEINLNTNEATNYDYPFMRVYSIGFNVTF